MADLDFEDLVRLLGSERWEQRRHAAVALGRLADARALAPLTERLQDRSARVRQAAATALARLGDAASIDPLTRLLQDRDGRVRAAAQKALVALSASPLADRLLGILEQSGSHTPHAVLDALVSLGDPDPLARALDHPNWAIRRGAVLALGRLKAAGPLQRALDDSHPEVRRAAVAALGPLGAVPALLSALADDNPGVRRAVVEALAPLRRKDAAILNALARAAATDADPGVRASAARVVCRHRSGRAVAPMLQALSSSDERVRLSAAAALGRVGAAAGTALAPLRERLREERSWRVRWRMRRAIRQISVALKSAPPELVAASAPEGSGSELQAAQALASPAIGGEVPDDATKERPWWQFWGG